MVWCLLTHAVTNLQPVGCKQPGTACSVTLPCLMPSWWKLCPIKQFNPAQPCPGCTTITQHQQNINAPLTLSGWTRTRGGHRTVLTQVMAKNCMHFYAFAKHSRVNHKKNMQSRLPFNEF